MSTCGMAVETYCNTVLLLRSNGFVYLDERVRAHQRRIKKANKAAIVRGSSDQYVPIDDNTARHGVKSRQFCVLNLNGAFRL